MSTFENLVRQNRSLADYREPIPGHDKRFLKKTRLSASRRKKINYMAYTLAVASLLAAAVILLSIIPGKQNDVIAHMPKEITEVIYYYDNMSLKLFESISTLKVADKNEFKQIRDDIESYEKWEITIMSDYRKFPYDERVQNAVIEFHKNKAEMLHDIFEQIKRKNYETI